MQAKMITRCDESEDDGKEAQVSKAKNKIISEEEDKSSDKETNEDDILILTNTIN